MKSKVVDAPRARIHTYVVPDEEREITRASEIDYPVARWRASFICFLFALLPPVQANQFTTIVCPLFPSL